MPFKVVKEQPQQKQFCEYVQNKIDIAREFNSIYELSDEDKRIQALYDNNQLKTSDRIKSLSRIKRQEDGEECLLISKDVVFTDKLTGLYKDRYSTIEGLVELPLTTTNEDGVTESNQIRLVYDIPFTKAKVLEAIKKAGTRLVKLRFFEGPETGNRVPRDTPIVGNLDFFLNATWEELLLGREKKLVSSRLNRLDELRKDVKKYDYSGDDVVDTNTDTNKPEEQNIIVEKENEQVPTDDVKLVQPKKIPASSLLSTGTGTGTVKLKVSNTANKKD